MTINIMLSLDLRPTQKRQIVGMIATLSLVSICVGRATTTKVWRVRDELAEALLPDATFDTIVGAKYLLTDLIGCMRLSGDGDMVDCLGFVGNTLQELFDYYTNLADCRGIL